MEGRFLSGRVLKRGCEPVCSPAGKGMPLRFSTVCCVPRPDSGILLCLAQLTPVVDFDWIFSVVFPLERAVVRPLWECLHKPSPHQTLSLRPMEPRSRRSFLHLGSSFSSECLLWVILFSCALLLFVPGFTLRVFLHSLVSIYMCPHSEFALPRWAFLCVAQLIHRLPAGGSC